MHYCPRCSRSGVHDGCCWCPECHCAIVEDIRQREAIRPGGQSCHDDNREAKKANSTKPMGPSLRDCKEILDDFVRHHVHVRGTGHYTLDDGSPWQAIALRHWEDASMIDATLTPE